MRLFVSLFAAVLALPAIAGDWPQWRGPNRDDVSMEKGLLKQWPKAGPTELWRFNGGGSGYSGPAIVGDTLYTMGAPEDTEFVMAIDVNTGKEKWKSEIGKRFKNSPWGDGPRGTPTVTGDSLYAMGGQGELVCLDTATGKKKWQKSLKGDLKGQMMSGWGYTESPLVDGDQVICTPGGSSGTLAALNKDSGEVIWRSKNTKDPAGYSSVIVADLPGYRHYVQLTGKGIVGIDPKTGDQLWYVDKSGSFRTAVIPTPIYFEGHVYATAGYGAGCDLVKLTASGTSISAEKIYTNKNMVNHHGGVVRIGRHIYGYSDNRGWVCQDFLKGDIVWAEKKLGKGSVVSADGLLYCYSESEGTAVLVPASPKGWREAGRFTLPQESSIRSPNGRIWTHPVVANGRLFLRDQDLIFCFDIKGSSTSTRK